MLWVCSYVLAVDRNGAVVELSLVYPTFASIFSGEVLLLYCVLAYTKFTEEAIS